MSAPLKKTSQGETETLADVIPIRSRTTAESEASSSYNFIDTLLNNPQFEEKLKSFFENRILSVYLNQKMELSNNTDNPFDAIYISELRPDPVLRRDIEAIVAMSTIEDKSSTIVFDDGWDD